MSPLTMGSEQRRTALEQANQARIAVAALKAQIRAGGPRAGALRAADAVKAGELPVQFLALLKAIPKVGDTNARLMLRHARISPAARVDSRMIGEPRRMLLVGELVAQANRR